MKQKLEINVKLRGGIGIEQITKVIRELEENHPDAKITVEVVF